MGVKDLRAKNSKPELETWGQPASGRNSAPFPRRVAKKNPGTRPGFFLLTGIGYSTSETDRFRFRFRSHRPSASHSR